MISSGISCKIFSNCQARSSTFPGRCSRLPIISKTCFIGKRSGDLDGHGSIRQFLEIHAVCRLALSYRKIRPGYCNRNSSKIVLGISLMYRCAASMNERGGRSCACESLMVDDYECDPVTAGLTLNLSSRSAVALGRPLPS
ncbi:hypothetical protein TNCV_924811 [Trichonephila clavipes]|nr:hypothetical protein TNCV_924811 [Trichonephila clavipes]